MEPEARRLIELGAGVEELLHTLRNLVFGIRANLEALRIEPNPELVLDEYLQRLDDDAGGLTALVHDLSELAQPACSQPHSVSLASLAHRAATAARPCAEEREIALAVHVPELEVFVDEPRIEEALRKLIISAIAATAAFGKVDVRAGAETARAELIVESDRACSESEGRGRPETRLELPIARRSFEANGGTVCVHDTTTGGRRIIVCIPRAEVSNR